MNLSVLLLCALSMLSVLINARLLNEFINESLDSTENAYQSESERAESFIRSQLSNAKLNYKNKRVNFRFYYL